MKDFVKNLVHRREGVLITDEEIEKQYSAWEEREEYFNKTGIFEPVGKFL